MTTDFSNKISLKVGNQLPEFIRNESDYETFVAFIQAYYEWMEQSNIGAGKKGAIYGTQQLLNYRDIDYSEPGESMNAFADYYMNEFLPNFPKDSLADKSKLVKIARELYQVKGTPASYEFLFRALYNSDAQLFPTRDVILKASDGKWYVSKSLRLATNDDQFLNINNLRVFGETSKSIATIERGIRVNDRIELYISNIERLFQSGEDIRVVDNNNQTLYFKDGSQVSSSIEGSAPLRAKILGSISAVNINPNKRGQLYRGRSTSYSGDPVVFYGGLNTANGIGATAYVNEVTAGSLKQIDVTQGSYGYREDPNTFITITGGGGSGAIANVAAVDPETEINVTLIPQDWLSYDVLNYQIDEVYAFFAANTVADANATLANTFTFTSFPTYSLESVIVNNGGGGYTSLPSIDALSLYDTTDPTTDSTQVKGVLRNLGILGPVQIVDGGSGYANGEFLVFSNGTGYGANANVTVNATGTIVNVEYQNVINEDGIQICPQGGLGYKNSALPTITIDTASGNNAILTVNTVLGDGAEFIGIPDERGIGAITSFTIENYGEDYISAPNISLRVRDIIVDNVEPATIVSAGEIVYQGDNIDSAIFKANIASINLIEAGATDNVSKYLLRVYNYTSNTKTDRQLVVSRTDSANLYYDIVTSYNTVDENENKLFENGIRTYGNGAARATAKFLNGLIIGEGRYINDDGFPSSFQILENEEYNNFTYKLSVQKSFSAYENVLKTLLHPSGMKVVHTHSIKSHTDSRSHRESFIANTKTLLYYTNDGGSSASIYGSFDTPSNNIIKFNNLVGANLEQILSPGAKIELRSPTGPNVYSEVLSVVDATTNVAVIKDNVYTYYANVAYGTATDSNNRINISTITNSFDLINNGEYSTENKLRDIAFAGDTIRVYANNDYQYDTTISYVSYNNNVIFLSNTSSFGSDNVTVSVGRTLTTTDVKIHNYLGTVFYPVLVTEDGNTIGTEDGNILIIG